ncbi:ABC transporter substrate-binding protein [Kiritimatiella glycovorans]|uniref:Vitamin B12-binding protein n=1 Tax=Kiritimatiella glycovorans TaxID=1307763 RepID=A0A0G3EHT9_9BACT|nr:helical backbone metal receptor [Kiritimatiella glycovorans]AKJ64365.1 Vitamin B12-binding protein precursor [Kiritimatiella glycovorans]
MNRTLAIILLSAAAVPAITGCSPDPSAPADRDRPPERIVSLAPSITEMLFALGLGSKVVGVSRFADYPPAVEDLPRVGGYVDPDYERILKLNPDLVCVVDTDAQGIEALRDLGLRVAALPHQDIEDIYRALGKLGRIFGVPERAEALNRRLRERGKALTRAADGDERPATLICISRRAGRGVPAEVIAIGPETFYHELLVRAGGRNVYEGSLRYPTLSYESLVRLDPEVIIDVHPYGQSAAEIDTLRNDWEGADALTAVRRDRVYIYTARHAAIPGPRFVKVLEDFVEMIHDDPHE